MFAFCFIQQTKQTKKSVVFHDFTDMAFDRPSTSLAQKRPSPITNDCLRPSKRHNSSQKGPLATNSPNTTKTQNKDESDGNILTNDKSTIKTNQSNDISIETNESNCDDEEDDVYNDDDNAKAGQSSRAIASSKWYSKPMPLSCKKLPIKPNLSYLSEDFMAKLKFEWTNAETNGNERSMDINDNVKLYNKPFKICLVQEFLQNKTQIQRMVYEMCQMEWQRKQMDLYEFHQTTDLANISAFSKPNLKKFYNMMSNDMLPWMRNITGLKQLTHISASCSMYNYSDYLLPHDDVHEDRRIAFIYYLSPWFDGPWTDKMGGALELFECDENTNQPKYPIVEKCPPRNDQFVFFRVCKQSFHQVGEVTNLVYPRLTINGWFHGPSSASSDNQDDIGITYNEEGNNLNVNNIEMLPPLTDEINLSEWIDPIYLNHRTKVSINQEIEDESQLSLESFLIQDFFDLLLSEFRENTELIWTLEGPANQQKYETLHFTAHSTGPPKDLYTLFASKSMFGLLHEYTELDFDGLHAKTPTCSVKICRFTQGCYTLLGSSSLYNDPALDVILFFGAKEGVGKITYLCPSEDPNDYNTTADTDATVNSSMNVSESYINSSLGNSSAMSVGLSSQSTTHVDWKRPMNQTELKLKKSLTPTMASTLAAASTSKLMVRESSSDMSLDETTNSHDPQDAEVNAIMHSSTTDKDSNSSKNETSVPNHSMDNDSEEENERSDSSSSNEVLALSDDDDEYDELAQEESFVTIHPQNNSLNLVYRLAGQTKFIKYISKNALRPDEYIYILMATYKD